MPIIEPKDSTLKQLSGLHLWHAPMSSCSQRVRIALAETGQDFESHLVALEKDEHASAAYQAIHPKGLVPAFVANGELMIESVDIIAAVAGDQLGAPSATAQDLLERADAAQQDLKLLTFEFLFRANPSPPPEAVEAFQQEHQNATLKQFRKDFAAGFDRQRLDDAVTRTDDGFQHLDRVLSDGRRFLDGETFGLADIAWMPNVHRFALMDWPFERTPRLQRWFAQVQERASYRTGLKAWEPEQVPGAVAAYTQQRRAQGTDVRQFGSLATSA